VVGWRILRCLGGGCWKRNSTGNLGRKRQNALKENGKDRKTRERKKNEEELLAARGLG